MLIFSGPNSLGLCSKLCQILGTKVGKVRRREFNDKEKHLEVQEEVFNRKVIILQSISTPTNDSLIDLMLLTDALKRASASHITIVAPYIGYCRQDRCPVWGVPFSFKVIANTLSHSGADSLFTVDLHSEQTQGLFDLQFCNLSTSSLFAEELLLSSTCLPTVVVSPDCGGSTRARRLAQKLGCEVAIATKLRSQANATKLLGIGGNVRGASCVVLDDIIDSGTTVLDVSDKLRLLGASEVHIYATHPVLSNLTQWTKRKDSVTSLTVTDSIGSDSPETAGIRVISIAGLIAETIVKGQDL